MWASVTYTAFPQCAQGAQTLGALAGGSLATAAGIRAPMLAGAPPIAAVAVMLEWRHRRD